MSKKLPHEFLQKKVSNPEKNREKKYAIVWLTKQIKINWLNHIFHEQEREKCKINQFFILSVLNTTIIDIKKHSRQSIVTKVKTL